MGFANAIPAICALGYRTAHSAFNPIKALHLTPLLQRTQRVACADNGASKASDRENRCAEREYAYRKAKYSALLGL